MIFPQLEFDITLAQIPVKIGGKEYILKEATGEASRKYRNAIMRSARTNEDGSKFLIGDGLADVEPLLVSLCLFEKKEDKEVPVPINIITSWPSRIQSELFKQCKKISCIDVPDTVEDIKERIEEDTKLLNKLTKKEETEKN